MSYDLFSDVFKLMEYSLDLRSRQNALISSNMVNYETPGYKPLRIDFHTSMRRALERMEMSKRRENFTGDITQSRNLNVESVMRVIRDESAGTGSDGNSVNIEREVAELEENTLLYSVTATLLAERFRALKTFLDQESRV